ncbi:MAG: tetratricopeptide repeat protein, partial [Longimicrobiales bacterium]
LLAGLLAERRGDLDTAERHYTQAVELDPTVVQAHKNLGDVAYRRGAHEHALSLYQRAAELAPDLGDDLYAKLGNLHYRARNRDGAIRCWKRALELNPRNDAVRNNLDIVAHA